MGFVPPRVDLAGNAVDRSGDLITDPVLVVATTAVLAAQAGALARRSLGSDLQLLDRVRMLETASSLALDARPAGPELALALTELVGPVDGWSRPWVELLEQLRVHPDPDLADRALAVFTEPE